jgi:hypothetical protein
MTSAPILPVWSRNAVASFPAEAAIEIPALYASQKKAATKAEAQANRKAVASALPRGPVLRK